MTEVLQPLNERVAETVVKNADLLESHAMEPLLLQLIAHVSAYRVIIKRCGLLPPRPFAAPLPRPPFASSSAPRTIHSATQVLCALRSAWLMYIHPAQIPNLRCCCQTSVKNSSQYHVRSCLQHRVFECIARKFRLQAEQGRGNSSGQPPPHCVSVDVRGIMAMARLLPRLDTVVLQPVCCVAGLPALPCTFASIPCQSKEKLMRPNDAAHGVCPLRTKSHPATAAVSVCAGQHQVDTRWVYIPVAVFPEPSQRPPANLVTAYFFFVARRGSMYDSDSALR